MTRYIALDCETGGIGLDKTLLTVFFMVLDEELAPMDQISFKLKPADGVYHVSAEALAINKINLIAHDVLAVTKSIAGQQLRTFLTRWSNNGAEKLVPIGHGVAFDLIHIHEHLLGRSEFEKYTSYRKLDTAVIAQFFKLQGKMPDSVSGSLTSLMEYYNLLFPNAHDAEADTRATVEVLKAMRTTL